MKTRKEPVMLSRYEAEIVIQALSAAASDEMRYRAHDILDCAIRAAREDKEFTRAFTENKYGELQ